MSAHLSPSPTHPTVFSRQHIFRSRILRTPEERRGKGYPSKANNTQSRRFRAHERDYFKLHVTRSLLAGSLQLQYRVAQSRRGSSGGSMLKLTRSLARWFAGWRVQVTETATGGSLLWRHSCAAQTRYIARGCPLLDVIGRSLTSTVDGKFIGRPYPSSCRVLRGHKLQEEMRSTTILRHGGGDPISCALSHSSTQRRARICKVLCTRSSRRPVVV